MTHALSLPDPQPHHLPKPRYRPVGVALLLLSMSTVGFLVFGHWESPIDMIELKFFQAQVEKNNVSEVEIDSDRLIGKFKSPPVIPIAKTTREDSTSVQWRQLKPQFLVFLTDRQVEDVKNLLLDSDVDVRLRSRN